MYIYHNGVIIGHEMETHLPAGAEDDCGGSGIVLSYNVEIYEPYRKQGHGSRAHVARLARWSEPYGPNYALCTVNRGNEPQLKILRNNGWVRLANTASQLGNPLYLMGKNLK